MARRLQVVRSTASVTWRCSCQKCACIAPVLSNGAVCHNCANGQHHNMVSD